MYLSFLCYVQTVQADEADKYTLNTVCCDVDMYFAPTWNRLGGYTYADWSIQRKAKRLAGLASAF